MAKNSRPKNPGIKWPKTPAAQLKEAEQHQDSVAAIATVGQLMTAAAAVPSPRAKKLLSDAVQEMGKGTIGANQRSRKGEKRSWEKHADHYFATNDAWTEVNGIYFACIDLLRTSLALVPLLKEEELLVHVTNKRLLSRNIHAITNDTKKLVEELGKIRAQHKDKDKGAISQEDLMVSCAVFSEYVQFMERYDSALMPLVVHASEQLQEGLLKLKDTNPELAAELNHKLLSNLAKIRNIVADTTGADPVPVPEEPQAAAPAAEAEPA
jgi:hypothetical protein